MNLYTVQLEGEYCSLVFQSLSWRRDGGMNLYTVQLEGEYSLVFQSLSYRRDESVYCSPTSIIVYLTANIKMPSGGPPLEATFTQKMTQNLLRKHFNNKTP